MRYTLAKPSFPRTGSPLVSAVKTICFKLVYLFILIGPAMTKAQPPGILWQKTLGGTANEHGRDVIQALDGGWLVVGETYALPGDVVTGAHGLADFLVVKLATNGNVEWQKAYGGTNYEFVSGALATADGGYYVFGSTMSADGDITLNRGNSDAWIIRIDSQGTIIWQKTYGGSGADAISGAKALPNGNLVLSGSTSSNDGDVSGNHGNPDYWFLTIDPSGTLISQKCFGGSAIDYGAGIDFSPDGNVVITGYAFSTDGDVTGNPSMWFCGSWTIKITLAGALLWERFEVPEFWDQRGLAVIRTHDGVVIAGTKSHYVYPDGADLWLVRYDENGNKIWDKMYGTMGADNANSIVRMTDGGLLVVGETWQPGSDGVSRDWSNFWVMKIGMPGNIIWQKMLGGTAYDIAWGAAVNSDGSMVVVGETTSNNGDVSDNHGSNDMWLVKLAQDPALPVSLINFSAQAGSNNSIDLKWVTANEVDNAYFEIEKSKDLKEVIPLTRISPDETPAATHTYRYTDEMPFQGTSYYRLKQVDTDGKTTTYPWRAVVLNRDYTVFPNPASGGNFHLRVDEPETAAIRFYDASGRMVPVQIVRSRPGTIEIRLPGQPRPGAYLLRVTERGQVREHRVVLAGEF